ncbi:MAG: DUF58 domain-containing protein [Candidatus Cyclobacteriaceae bacterium M3_2C_046]
MDLKELYKKLRKYEIQIRKVVKSHMQGDFHSIFKGSGLEFDDVRSYQYGDDIRRIDWNVSAKGHGTFVKTFKEEKEQTVFFVLDVSASQEIGLPGKQKLDIGKEIAGVLTLSSIKEDSQVGLICYSDQKEKFIKPGKGARHAYELLNSLFRLNPSSIKTNLSQAILFGLNMIKRRSVIVLISDFLDDNYFHNLKAMARKHDLVVIHLFDNRETRLPRLGIIPLFDKESKKTVWINTSSTSFRKSLKKTYIDNRDALEVFCRKNSVNYLQINTDEDYIPKLIKLFKVRNKTLKAAR